MRIVVRRDPRFETPQEEYQRIYCDATDAEVGALYQLYGSVIHEVPTLVMALIHEVRTKH